MPGTGYFNLVNENIRPALFEVSEVGFWNFIETKNEQNFKCIFIKTRWFWNFDLSDLDNGL